MKFILPFYFTLLFAPLFSLGQMNKIENFKFVQIGNITRGGASLPEVALEMAVSQSDTMYVLRFDDASIQSPVFSSSQPSKESVYFLSTNNSINQLYDLLKNVFEDKLYETKDYETIFLLGSRTVVVKRDYYSDKTRIHFIVDGSRFVIKNKKELDRLFNK
jgi:hypothetical protein